MTCILFIRKRSASYGIGGKQGKYFTPMRFRVVIVEYFAIKALNPDMINHESAPLALIVKEPEIAHGCDNDDRDLMHLVGIKPKCGEL
ncbi:hypothetical protein D9M71_670500 [compost metagenome]